VAISGSPPPHLGRGQAGRILLRSVLDPAAAPGATPLLARSAGLADGSPSHAPGGRASRHHRRPVVVPAGGLGGLPTTAVRYPTDGGRHWRQPVEIGCFRFRRLNEAGRYRSRPSADVAVGEYEGVGAGGDKYFVFPGWLPLCRFWLSAFPFLLPRRKPGPIVMRGACRGACCSRCWLCGRLFREPRASPRFAMGPGLRRGSGAGGWDGRLVLQRRGPPPPRFARSPSPVNGGGPVPFPDRRWVFPRLRGNSRRSRRGGLAARRINPAFSDRADSRGHVRCAAHHGTA
jgi:hypothetical protein